LAVMMTYACILGFFTTFMRHIYSLQQLLSVLFFNLRSIFYFQVCFNHDMLTSWMSMLNQRRNCSNVLRVIDWEGSNWMDCYGHWL